MHCPTLKGGSFSLCVYFFYGYYLFHSHIQAKVPTPQEQWECTKLVLFSHFTIELPAVCIFLMQSSDRLTIAVDLAFPPYCGGVRHVNMARSVSRLDHYGSPGRVFLRI